MNKTDKEQEINSIQLRIIYAQNFTPHKVEYWKERLKEVINSYETPFSSVLRNKVN